MTSVAGTHASYQLPLGVDDAVLTVDGIKDTEGVHSKLQDVGGNEGTKTYSRSIGIDSITVPSITESAKPARNRRSYHIASITHRKA